MTTQTMPPQSAAPGPPHSRIEDAVGLLTGAVLASLGLFLLHSAEVITGGTAGVALLLEHVLPVPFGLVYALVTVPFILLGVHRKGWSFALRSVTAVALVSTLSLLQPHVVAVTRIAPLYGALIGNLVLGLGILILFRHRSSLGGFNVVALLAQERRGWSAGYVQLALDGLVIGLSALTTSSTTVLYSGAGAIILNLLLATNHRPGRYLGA